MTATGSLREDHRHIMRLEKVISACYAGLYEGADIPIRDMERITLVIAEFLDSIHYSREEDSYFACVAGYGTLHEEIRAFMIEHEFGRRIAHNVSRHLARLKAGDESAREPVARFLRTYSIYLLDHVSKEEKFFDAAAKTLSPEEEKEMYEQFRSVTAVSKTVKWAIKEVEYLESRPWARAAGAEPANQPKSKDIY